MAAANVTPPDTSNIVGDQEDVPMSSKPSTSSKGDSGTSATGGDEKPCCLIVLGMAGSGKTTFVQVIQFFT